MGLSFGCSILNRLFIIAQPGAVQRSQRQFSSEQAAADDDDDDDDGSRSELASGKSNSWPRQSMSVAPHVAVVLATRLQIDLLAERHHYSGAIRSFSRSVSVVVVIVVDG